MTRKVASMILAAVFGMATLSGCGSGSGTGSNSNSQDNRQPKLKGPADPNSIGPALPAGGAKPAEIK
jgi:hypothetical protein